MILKRLLESKPKEIPDIELNDDEIFFAEKLKDLDPKFENLRNNTIRTLRNIFLDDYEIANKETEAEDFLEWFYNGHDSFLEFVCDYWDHIPTSQGRSSKNQLPVFVIRDLAENEDKFADALTKVAKRWHLIDKDGVDISDPERTNRHVPTTGELVETLFLDCCNNGIKTGEDYSNETDLSKIPDINVKGKDLLKVLAIHLMDVEGLSMHDLGLSKEEVSKELEEEKEHVCEKCGHSPCICEEADEEIPVEKPIEEPKIETPVEEPSPTVEEHAFTDMINNAIQQEWNLISALNGIAATFDFEYKDGNKQDIINVLNQIVDDTTINIGMLHKAAELVSLKTSELLDAGEEKAEEIIEQ